MKHTLLVLIISLVCFPAFTASSDIEFTNEMNIEQLNSTAAFVNFGFIVAPSNKVASTSTSEKETKSFPATFGIDINVPADHWENDFWTNMFFYGDINSSEESDGNQSVKVAKRYTLLSTGLLKRYPLSSTTFLSANIGPMLAFKKYTYTVYDNKDVKNKTVLGLNFGAGLNLVPAFSNRLIAGFEARFSYFSGDVIFRPTLRIGYVF